MYPPPISRSICPRIKVSISPSVRMRFSVVFHFTYLPWLCFFTICLFSSTTFFRFLNGFCLFVIFRWSLGVDVIQSFIILIWSSAFPKLISLLRESDRILTQCCQTYLRLNGMCMIFENRICC